LTHFFSGNYHAIDFRCDIGTPLVAVADGIVVQVKTDSTVTGIAVSNLFQWNSILLQITPSPTNCIPQEQWKQCFEQETPVDDCEFADGPLFVEYVHIQSSCVQPGDRVVAGQQIGESGSIGFSPEPHLHLAAYRSAEDGAPTCRVFFHAKDDRFLSSSTKAALSEEVAIKSTPKLFLPLAGRRYNSLGMVEA
jgi:murein DD-endopeptidase MepM/ murein hydrolase activator NlpD